MWLYNTDTYFLERLTHGSDLLRSITDIYRRLDRMMGVFTAIGAVKRARVAFYDQGLQRYAEMLIDEEAEILSCLGNVSVVDGGPFVHAHMTLGFRDGRVCGGHLLEGTEVFASEVFGCVLEGPVLNRYPDDVTGLRLWKD